MDIVVPGIGNSQLQWSIIGSDMPSALGLVDISFTGHVGVAHKISPVERWETISDENLGRLQYFGSQVQVIPLLLTR